ncbi:glutamine synthetase/guanido kinase [Periconia macrospinosa]|uniref:Glutamine synthetase n=1 Tax=Periconia macrospinosa TaxID=97972 RepID=A0A2V1DZH7_9PLEO|nr:glutamine synthetase/guanido kinase [Periconia macrospinosa]
MDPTDPNPSPTIEQLRYITNNYPIIDNHAGNLILPVFNDSIPFESITSEAKGRALRDAPKSLAHLRASQQLRQLYECPEDADWADVLEQRVEWLRSNPGRLIQRCFEGVHALLIDDGMPGPDRVYPYNFTDQYTKALSLRIVRIETVAESLMQIILRDVPNTALDHATFFTDTWVAFTDEFEREILEAIRDPAVAGFKTIISYRSGLDIEPDYQQAAQEVGHPFERYVERCLTKKKFRIDRKELNDYLVLRTLEVLSEQLSHPDALSKPLQVHTGLGDNDISLLQANPAYLQPLIEGYSKVPFVLLHSSYPYTREAGYLATVYRHVYLDLGGVFPMLSRDGQKNVLRDSFELVPGSKLLYSSSGKFFPETFWLANRQFREALLELTLEYIEKKDITPHQAISMTKDILFNNSNILYDLRYEAVFNEAPLTQGHITYNVRTEPEPVIPEPPVPQTPLVATTSHIATSRTPEGAYEPPPFPPPPKEAQVYDVHILEGFLAEHKDVKFVYVQWLDYTAIVRSRVVPIKEFTRLIHSGSRIPIPSSKIGLLQQEETAPVATSPGEIYIEPDLRSLRRTHSKDPLPSATVLSFWRDPLGRPIRDCPRANLEHLLGNLKFNYNITLLCGFEVDVTFLGHAGQPLNQNHTDETITPEQWLRLDFLADIVTALSDTNIDLQQVHAVSGPGQYRFVFSPQSPLEAIDSFIQARQVIFQLAALHGLTATLHPQPYPRVEASMEAILSMVPPERDVQFFAEGVLRHMGGICAFTMPEPESYGKSIMEQWAAVKEHALKEQSQDTSTSREGSPVYRSAPGHWKIRCLDGFANLYFALSAIIAAGSLGLAREGSEFRQHEGEPHGEDGDEENDRPIGGIVKAMPVAIEDAVYALSHDEELKEALPEALVRKAYLVGNMRKEETRDGEPLGREEAAKRRDWLIERY